MWDFLCLVRSCYDEVDASFRKDTKDIFYLMDISFANGLITHKEWKRWEKFVEENPQTVSSWNSRALQTW